MAESITNHHAQASANLPVLELLRAHLTQLQQSLDQFREDDGTIVTRNRVTFIVFDRKAESLEKAIRSATVNVLAAGFDVKRVEMPAFEI